MVLAIPESEPRPSRTYTMVAYERGIMLGFGLALNNVLSTGRAEMNPAPLREAG